MQKSGISKIANYLKDQIKLDYNLSKNSWFGIGGNSSIFFQPKNKEALKYFLLNYKIKKNIIIGSGSNILFKETNNKDIVIKLGPGFTNIKEINGKIFAESAALKSKVSEFALKNSYSKFEFMSCIPGTIGGGVIMNAGCFGSEFSDVIEEVYAITLNGDEIILKKSEIKFEYRKSNINENLIILGVLFAKTKKNNSDKILEKINILKSKKKKNQPSSIKTGVSTFKNPTYGTSLKAWQLIKKYNCDTLRFGKAKYSSKHCNFIDNTEKASSEEIEQLIQETQKKIFLQSGIKLELEIKII